MLETEEGSEKYRFQSSELPFVLLRVFERYHFERQGIFPMKRQTKLADLKANTIK